MIETTPLNEQIAHELKGEILNGVLEPGQKISIEDLAQRWNVSTTPVRDAIRSLEASGFVKVSPRKSVFVGSMDFKAFKDVFDLRIVLECLAVEQSVERIPQTKIEKTLDTCEAALEEYKKNADLNILKHVDNLVHDLVISYSDNQKLIQIMDELHDLIDWARSMVGRQPKSYDAAIYEHIQVLKALKKKDTQAAILAMRTHLKNSFERTRQGWNDGADRKVSEVIEKL